MLGVKKSQFNYARKFMYGNLLKIRVLIYKMLFVLYTATQISIRYLRLKSQLSLIRIEIILRNLNYLTFSVFPLRI